MKIIIIFMLIIFLVGCDPAAYLPVDQEERVFTELAFCTKECQIRGFDKGDCKSFKDMSRLEGSTIGECVIKDSRDCNKGQCKCFCSD